ncbi:bidirectional sugar transporter SWEET5-like [Impatiens glandulifera]|uniref:bidirectional sugar transporter SWEET5-like n=1 Tax=Impatiens glandulifera TaxID=253017 RepID=UPI001FB1270A|nr:bidirectional sugar transporter SWEET5-like [Impatiens glandulifera]
MALSREGIRNLVGIIGNVISFCLFMSPLPTFIAIWRAKSVQKFKPDPYLATLLNCAMWVFYAMPFVHPDALLVGTINGIGFVVELAYVIFYFSFAGMKKRKMITVALSVGLAFMVFIIAITMIVFHTTTYRSLIVGTICVVLNVVMYASPLTIMSQVIKTKSVKYMPFWISFTNFVNAVIWLVYALIKFDLYVAIPNGLGTFFGATQLILYSTYYKSTNWDEDDDKPSNIEMPTREIE